MNSPKSSVRTQQEIMRNWDPDSHALVSVCCITYNHEQYLREAVDSFLMQETNFKFEILLHDDASTDGTADIVKAYAEKYPDIIKPILQSENQFSKGGLINPRLVIPHAKGKYIALCEGDDYWTDDTKLQQQISFLENNLEYVLTYSDCQPFDENGLVNIDFGGATKDLESIDLKKATPIFTLTTCFRNLLGEIPQDLMSAIYGDLVMWSLLGAHGKGKYLGEIKPSAYRVHSGGIHSKKSLMDKAGMTLITFSALYAYYKRRGGEEEVVEHYKERILKYALLMNGVGGVSSYFIFAPLRLLLRMNRKIIKKYFK